MEAIRNAVEPYRQSMAYVPIGIILSTIPWIILTKITEKIPYVDAAHLKKTLLALLFTGAYVYMWTQESNPHDAEIKENTFADEVFLFLAGAYYIAITQEQSWKHNLHDFFYVVFIIMVIIHGKVGAPANNYGFLVEAPKVFLMLSGFVQNLHCMPVTWALKNLSLIVYFLSNIGICDLVLIIIISEKAPVLIKVLFLFLSVFRFLNIIEEVGELMGSQKVTNTLKCVIPKCRTSSNTSVCCRHVSMRC